MDVDAPGLASGSVADPIRIESTHADFDALLARVGLLGDHQRDNALPRSPPCTPGDR